MSSSHLTLFSHLPFADIYLCPFIVYRWVPQRTLRKEWNILGVHFMGIWKLRALKSSRWPTSLKVNKPPSWFSTFSCLFLQSPNVDWITNCLLSTEQIDLVILRKGAVTIIWLALGEEDRDFFPRYKFSLHLLQAKMGLLHLFLFIFRYCS